MRRSNPDGEVAEPTPARLRCAIYTRKSTEEGLDQEFNSLDAQREAAEAFIQSQRREGWIASPAGGSPLHHPSARGPSARGPRTLAPTAMSATLILSEDISQTPPPMDVSEVQSHVRLASREQHTSEHGLGEPETLQILRAVNQWESSKACAKRSHSTSGYGIDHDEMHSAGRYTSRKLTMPRIGNTN